MLVDVDARIAERVGITPAEFAARRRVTPVGPDQPGALQARPLLHGYAELVDGLLGAAIGGSLHLLEGA